MKTKKQKLNVMKAITLKLQFIVLITLFTQVLNAQCTGCNLTITVPTSSSFNLTPGQTVCIVGTGNFTGTLNSFSGNTLCIGSGVNYNPSSPPNYNGNWTIINNGTFSNTGNLNFNSGTSFTNGPTGSINLTNSVSINSGTTFNNFGTMQLNSLTINGGGSVQLGGTTTISGALNNNGNLTVHGFISASSITNNSGASITGGSSTSCNYLTTSGTFTNNGSIGGTGNALIIGATLSGSGTISSPASTAISTPSSQPTSLNLTFNGTSVNGTFNQASSSVGGYIILRATNTINTPPATTNPTNYRNLTVGQTLGLWEIVAFNNGQNNTTFSDNVSSLCNFIHYRILSYNLSGNCRVYNTSSPLTNFIDIRPTITSTSPGTLSGAGSVVLGATASSGIVNWYATSSGGSILGTGNTFNTPSISTTTNYFAEAVNGSCISSTRTQVTATIVYPEIEIRGNGFLISSGDTTPSTTDFTILGTTDVTYGSITRTFQIRNLASTGVLNIGGITFTGTNASDFSIGTPPPSTIATNGTSTFTIVFNPSGLGTRNATINIPNNDQNENPYTFAISGTGIDDVDGDLVDANVDLDNDNDGIRDNDECRTCTFDPFQNGSFESPSIPTGTMAFLPTASVTGWQTSAENVIEIWNSGFNGVTAAAGNQFAELNANVPGVLYQTFCLNGAGGTINWSIRHRGRSGTDTAFVKFGSSLANALASTPIVTMVSGNTSWASYSGTYTIPTGMRQIVLTFQAGPTASGDQSVGNFIDDIQITINQSCIDSDGDGVADVNDLDSDNDGIPDIEENGFRNLSNQTGTFDKTNSALWADTNNNGYNDYIEAMISGGTYVILNTDGDAVPNYIDLDSDNDSLFDTDEAGILFGDGDIDGNGTGDYADTDGDGIMNIHDNLTGFGVNAKAYAQDTDTNGVGDYLQLDANTDGTFDIRSGLYATLDANNDGRIDGSADADTDGLLDSFDSNTSLWGSPRNLDQKLYLSFDGRNDFAEDTPILGGLSTLTLMAWISLNPAFTGTGVVVGQNNCYIRVSGTRQLQVVINGNAYAYTNITALDTSRWYHVGITLGAGTLTVFVNGDPQTFSVSGAINADASNLTLGRNPGASNMFFFGKMDEVRVFNTNLSTTQFQRIINQEIFNNSAQVRGTFVPLNVGSLNYATLLRYYRMDAYRGDIADNFTTPTIDTGSGLRLFNVKAIAPQEAPMPYVTVRAGSLATAVDDPSRDIHGNDVLNYNWNIIDVRHNITETTNSTDLGMVINPGVRVTMNNDTRIQNSWYLKIDGVLDLQGRSQLIQTNASELDVTSAGAIERDQQGTSNLFNYNYWSSPVSAINTTINNGTFTVNSVLKDGTTATPQNITWTNGLNGSPTAPITLSNYWIFKFQNLTNSYANWQSVGANGSLNTGEGFTLKGSGAATANQNLTFVGKPNNGTITIPIAANNLNLTGNPYPSAIDANLFISLNSGSTTGTLYFWEHANNNNTHNLTGYQGGYSVRNLTGGVGPTAPAGINGVGTSTKIPGRYIPVGQGFFVVGSTTGGNITFQNSHRAFVRENNSASNTLFRHGNTIQNYVGNNEEDPVVTDQYARLRLGMTSKDNYHRNILLGFMEDLASHDYDYGYDAETIDNQNNDVYFVANNKRMVIQGVDYFDINTMYPIGVKAYVTGEIKFTMDEVENLPSTQRYYILDQQDGIFHDITNQPFVVEVPQGNTDNRFVLAFKNTTALNTDDHALQNGVQMVYTQSNTQLTIKNYVADATIHTVVLYNMLGQEVMTYKVTGQDQTQIQIPVRGISAGTYIAKAISDQGTTSKKIVFN